MNFVFVSNYYNHHQRPLSMALQALCEREGRPYTFVQTETRPTERLPMGGGDVLRNDAFVISYADDPQGCQRLIDEADAVMFGGTDDESYIQTRLKQKKPVWRYSERLYKTGRYRFVSPRGLRRKFLDHTRHDFGRVYLLCSGAYVAGDYRLVAAYPFKKFQFGYFPAHAVCDADQLIAEKYMAEEAGQTIELLWAARMIAWKHPERALLITEELLKDGIPVHLTMAGGGPLEADMRALVTQKGLTRNVDFVGFRDPEMIRSMMRKSHVYLATSDREEGWGAVINEAMDSACLVVADRAMGAAPYLIRNGENGISYPVGRTDAAVSALRRLLKEPGYAEMRRMQKAAYETIGQLWNADVAAERLYACVTAELRGERMPEYKEGPMSRA